MISLLHPYMVQSTSQPTPCFEDGEERGGTEYQRQNKEAKIRLLTTGDHFNSGEGFLTGLHRTATGNPMFPQMMCLSPGSQPWENWLQEGELRRYQNYSPKESW